MRSGGMSAPEHFEIKLCENHSVRKCFIALSSDPFAFGVGAREYGTNEEASLTIWDVWVL